MKRVVSDLGVDLSPAAVHELHVKLAVIIGQWMAEQQRLEVSSVSGALLSTARNLNEAAVTLGGFETGLHSGLETAVASRIARYLAVVPGVSSLAEAQEAHFIISARGHSDSPRLHGGRADLPDRSENLGVRRWIGTMTSRRCCWSWRTRRLTPGPGGRGGIGSEMGWLIEAARALESSFLYREMRSPSSEACGKRLQRSRRRLRLAKGQNHRAR